MRRRAIAAVAGAIAWLCPIAGQATTFTVSSLADSGAGSLREAVGLANSNAGGDTIDFSVNGTITLTTGGIQITSGPLTIDGPGVGNLTLDGNLSSRIFAIIEGGTLPACPALTGPADYPVTIRHMTLANARRNVVDSSGGAIFTAHSLTLDDVTLTNNAAKQGGGVAFRAQYANQALSILHSSFNGNGAMPVATGNTGSYAGGAVSASDYCTGTHTDTFVAISDSLFQGNYVSPGTLNGSGGAISAFDGTYLTIARSRIVGNGIELPNPPGAFSFAGGGVNANWVTISDSEISGNFAQYAGGIVISQNAANLQTEGNRKTSQISNSTIWGNTATQDGGGVEVYGNVQVNIVNSTVADNTALVGSAGGVVTGRAAGASFLDPRLSLSSSVLAGAQLNNKTDLHNWIGNTPTISVDSDNSMILAMCGACGITLVGASNQVGVDPKLGPPSQNGGPLVGGSQTLTMPLLAGSPAKDMGNNFYTLTNDQRGAGFPRSVGAGVDMGAMEGVGYCSGMADIPSDATSCANVDWLRNRHITLGCTATTYCPNDSVTRAQMAIFMNRLGAALSPNTLSEAVDLGSEVVPEVGSIALLCKTDFVAPEPYRRAALVSGRVNGLADAAVSWRASLFYSVDGGGTWLQTPTNVGLRVYAEGGEWSNSSPNTVFQLARDLEYTFAIGINRDDVITGLTGNFSQAHCDLTARVVNRNGTTAPF